MGLLSVLLGRTSTEEILKNIDLGSFFYADDYEKNYPTLLQSGTASTKKQKRVAELLLFRAWVTNIGFHCFSTRNDAPRRVTYEVVNLSNTLGRMFLDLKYGINLDKISNVDYGTLLDSRWRHYDCVLLENRTGESPIADFAVAGAVLELCGCLGDPLGRLSIATEYLRQMSKIRQTANAHGL